MNNVRVSASHLWSHRFKSRKDLRIFPVKTPDTVFKPLVIQIYRTTLVRKSQPWKIKGHLAMSSSTYHAQIFVVWNLKNIKIKTFDGFRFL